MSSISGRFLFKFGITAAVAVLVSLLVSFTLTPDDERAFVACTSATAGEQGAVTRRISINGLTRAMSARSRGP